MPLHHLLALLLAADAVERVVVALRLQDGLRLLRRFVNAGDDEPALGFRVHLRLRRGLEHGARPVHHVAHGRQPAGHRVFDGRLLHQFLGRDEIADGVVGLLRPGVFLQRQHLVFERVLAHVKQRLARQRRELDQVFLRAQAQERVLQQGFARPAAGKDEQRQRIVHLPAGHRQIADGFVGQLADEAEAFQVAEDFADQIGMTAEFQRLALVRLGDELNLASAPLPSRSFA